MDYELPPLESDEWLTVVKTGMYHVPHTVGVFKSYNAALRVIGNSLPPSFPVDKLIEKYAALRFNGGKPGWIDNELGKMSFNRHVIEWRSRYSNNAICWILTVVKLDTPTN